MGRGKFPSWLFVAVVVGLLELTYWLYSHFGFGMATKSALSLTFFVAVVSFLFTLARRVVRKRKI